MAEIYGIMQSINCQGCLFFTEPELNTPQGLLKGPDISWRRRHRKICWGIKLLSMGQKKASRAFNSYFGVEKRKLWCKMPYIGHKIQYLWFVMLNIKVLRSKQWKFLKSLPRHLILCPKPLIKYPTPPSPETWSLNTPELLTN